MAIRFDCRETEQRQPQNTRTAEGNHAMRRQSGKHDRVCWRSALTSCLVVSLALVLTRLAAAQSASAVAPTASATGRDKWTYYGLSKWHVDKRFPERSIPTPEQRDEDPIEYGYFLMDASDLAEFALKRGDHAEAITYFKTLAKAVPEKAVSYRKVCISYQALSDWQNALAFCKEALSKEGTFVEDFARYAQIMIQMKPQFTADDGLELDEVVAHLRNQVPKDTLADEIACDVGLKLHDNERMKECTDRLATAAPNNPKTISYQWAYAMQRGDVVTARRIIDQAKRVGVPHEVIRRLQDGTKKLARSGHLGWLNSRVGLVGILAAVVFVILLLAASRAKRRRLNAATS